MCHTNNVALAVHSFRILSRRANAREAAALHLALPCQPYVFPFLREGMDPPVPALHCMYTSRVLGTAPYKPVSSCGWELTPLPFKSIIEDNQIMHMPISHEHQASVRGSGNKKER